MDRIKHLIQKESNGSFVKKTPLGADGINIDMLSGSNLEEELHLGSPSQTSFGQNGNGQTVITEVYKKEDNQTTDYFILTTTFESDNGSTIIIQRLFFVVNDVSILKKIKRITFDSSSGNLVIKEEIE